MAEVSCVALAVLDHVALGQIDGDERLEELHELSPRRHGGVVGVTCRFREGLEGGQSVPLELGHYQLDTIRVARAFVVK
eukprot:886365-Rhodomonas_salina.1